MTYLGGEMGLNVENCERWLESGVLVSVALMVVIIVIRVRRYITFTAQSISPLMYATAPFPAGSI
jgi:hypothetical protein